jgi:hypothetical protein
MDSDEVFHLTAKFSPNANVADKHPILVNFKPRRGLLPAGARINCAEIDLQPIENVVALSMLHLLENFAVELLYYEHGGTTGQNAVVSGQFLTGGSGRKQRNNFLLREGRFARENRLGREGTSININSHGVIADQRRALQIDPWIKRIARVEIEKPIRYIEPAERQRRFHALQFDYSF